MRYALQHIFTSIISLTTSGANHRILPHNGKNITFRDLNITVRQAFNFAPSFCFFVPKFSADFLDRSYWTDAFDLEELSKHNTIEHDASLTRKDATLMPDQRKPDLALVNELLATATGKECDGDVLLAKEDLSKQLAKRREEARARNLEYSESLFTQFSVVASMILRDSQRIESYVFDRDMVSPWQRSMRRYRLSSWVSRRR